MTIKINLDPSKQPQEVIFSKKINKDFYPRSSYNNSDVYQATS